MNIIKHPEFKFGPMHYVKAEEKRYIITHHPAAKLYSPSQIHNQHLGQGWSGAGYNFYVRKDGSVHELREELAVGAHCPGKNRDGIGVCFEGDYSIETIMPKEQLEAGTNLLSYLMKKYNIPLGNVKRHSDHRATTCPGVYFPWNALLTTLGSTGIVSKPLTFIKGNTTITSAQAYKFINDRNSNCKITVLLSELLDYYFDYCKKYMIRAEIAIAQAIHETNYFSYGNIVQPNQNNFAGLGALDGNTKGSAASFKSAKEGVLAHVQHLKAYADTEPIKGIVDPRFNLVRRGAAEYLEYLSIPNNPSNVGWATDKDYANKIKNIIHGMDGVKIEKQHWAIPLINELKNKNIISEFHNPTDVITFAHLAAILSNFEDYLSKDKN